MWIVFRKSDQVVVGKSSISGGQRPKDAILTEVVTGLADGGATEDFEAVQVPDPKEAMALFDAEMSGQKEIVIEDRDGKFEAKARSIKVPDRYLLQLTPEKGEVHPVDGIRVIPTGADSGVDIQLQKVSASTEAPVTRLKDNDELWLRTDHGTLLGADGKPVRSLRLAKGAGSFRLQAGPERRVACVQVLCASEEIEPGGIRVEFA